MPRPSLVSGSGLREQNRRSSGLPEPAERLLRRIPGPPLRSRPIQQALLSLSRQVERLCQLGRLELPWPHHQKRPVPGCRSRASPAGLRRSIPLRGRKVLRAQFHLEVPEGLGQSNLALRAQFHLEVPEVPEGLGQSNLALQAQFHLEVPEVPEGLGQSNLALQGLDRPEVLEGLGQSNLALPDLRGLGRPAARDCLGGLDGPS